MKKEISVSDIFVKKIWEKIWLLTKDEIVRLWLLSWGSKSRSSYALSILLGRKLIENIAKWLYRVRNEEWRTKNKDEDYWAIIEKLVYIYSPSGGVVGGEKALELHLQNYSIPEILIIYTRDTNKRIRLSDAREVHFRTLVSWEKTGKKNLYRILFDTKNTLPEYRKISFLSLEWSLLDALSLKKHEIGIEEGNILRFLKSFHSMLSRDTLGNLVKYRYIRAMNRLRAITRDNGYEDLYKKTLEIIRDEGWGCYVNV